MTIEEREPGDDRYRSDDYDSLGAFFILLFAALHGTFGWRYRIQSGERK